MSKNERERLSLSLRSKGMQMRALAHSLQRAMDADDSELIDRLLKRFEQASNAAIVDCMLLKANLGDR